MTEVKITKTIVLSAIMGLVEDLQAPVIIELEDGATINVTSEDIKEYCETTINQIATKASKAKEKAAEKKEKSDALREEVLSHITDELQSADQITALVTGFEEVTKSKVVARLTQLCKAGLVEKEQQKAEDNRKIMMYRLASVE